ncbi:unnamed protein product [Heterosigma akashiwo]
MIDTIRLSSSRIFDMKSCLLHRESPSWPPPSNTAAMADRCLDLVLEFDRDAEEGRLGELGRAVRAHRFRAHNRAWLQTMDQDEFAQTRHGHDEGSYKYDSDADAPPGNGGVYGGGGGGGHHPGGGFPEDSMDHGSGEVDPRLLMDYGGQHERVAMDMGMLYTQQAGHAAAQQPNPGSDGGGGRRPGDTMMVMMMMKMMKQALIVIGISSR